MSEDISSTHQKARQINIDARRYGAFAEIGAGQETARWFFRVGGAAGTVAKTISAYDMTVSDAIYGPTDRYVSRQRLSAMLDYEFNRLQQRLDESRGDKCTFFAFANTVATHSFTRQEEGHGWLGIRFQTEPRGPASEIFIHIRMLDKDNERQQEALGIIGVNFIHGAFYLHREPETLIRALLDHLTWERVEVDLIHFSGPAFAAVDNRLMALALVRQGLTEAAMFTAAGEAVQWAELLYKKPVLVQRGSFLPVTNATLDVLERATEKFVFEPDVRGDTPVVLMEMTLRQLTTGLHHADATPAGVDVPGKKPPGFPGESGYGPAKAGDAIDPRDFLDRADTLTPLGQTVLVSNFRRFHRLAAYLSRYTPRPIGLAMGASKLAEIFDEQYYNNNEGGLLGGLGQLFKNPGRLYVYPILNFKTGQVLTAANFPVPPALKHLYAHCLENRLVQDVQSSDADFLRIRSHDVLEKIKAGDAAWEKMVPPPIVEVIKRKKLFGCV